MMVEVGVIRNRLVLLYWRFFYILASGEFLFRSSQDKPRFITSSIDACRLTLSTACIHRHSSRRARKDACATRNARGAAHWLYHRGKCAKSHCKSNRPTATRSHSAHRDSRSPQMSSLRRSREFPKAEMRQKKLPYNPFSQLIECNIAYSPDKFGYSKFRLYFRTAF